MKKIVIEKAGNYDQIKLKESPNPIPSKGEVLIETHACGVNFADCCVRMGVYSSAKEFVGWPITPGFEVSGVVTALGAGVTKFSIGQRVVALTRFGGYATHIAVSEDIVFSIPEGMEFIEAAAIPAVFLTAYYALFELSHPKEGNRALVHSAAGGVGSALIQLCKLAGCRVVGVVGSAHKFETARSLGADKVIDKSSQNLWKLAEEFSPEGYDIIFDANGIETLTQSYRHLNCGGKLVVYGFHTMFTKGRGTPNWFKLIWDYFRTPKFNPLTMTNDNHSVLAFNLSYLFDKTSLLQDAMVKILKLFEEKKLIVPPITTFPIEQAAEAHRALETGKTIGKLVLTTKIKQK